MASIEGFRYTCGSDWRWTGDLEDFVRRYGHRLAVRVRRMLRACGEDSPRREQVDDVLQELYCRLLEEGGRRLERCRATSERQLVAYVARIAERVAVDHWRSERMARLLVPASLRPETHEPADSAASPEALALVAEARRLLLARCEAVVKGRNRRRDGSILRLLLEGWSSREIATMAGGRMPPAVVDSLLYRVRKRLAAKGLALPTRHRSPSVASGRGVSSGP